MIIDHVRDLDEFKNLYESRPMPSQYDFNWLVNNPNLFCFYSEPQDFDTSPQSSPQGEAEEKLLGFITIQREDGELTLSGTSIRKNYKNIITALKIVCNEFKEDIFAYTPLKEAGIVLKKVGFEKVHNRDNKINKWRLRNG